MKTLEEIVAGAAEEPGLPADREVSGEAYGDAPGEAEPEGGDAPADGEAPEAAGEAPGRTVPVSALIDERRKRRAAEERLARQGPAPGSPRFRDDPEGYLRALEGNVAARIAAVWAGHRRVFFHALTVDFETGVGDGTTPAPVALLDWSDDGGHTWSADRAGALDGGLGATGEYGRRVVWRRLGAARQRYFRVVVTDPVKVAILGAGLDATVGAS